MNCAKKVSITRNTGASHSASLRFVLILVFLASVFWPPVPGLYAQTELGSEDDLTVLGTNGTAGDPDTEIKGFTVFGSTQAGYTGAVIGSGNVVVNGVLSVSSGAYFVGDSTFTSAGKIFINDGSSGQVLRKGAAGSLTWDNVSALGDDLGSHVATQNLVLQANQLTGTGALTMSSITASGPLGMWAARLVFDPNIEISSYTSAVYGKGVYLSTSVFTPGLAITQYGELQTTGAGRGSVAGAARGPGAVDLQVNRGLATQVASGGYAVIGGGQQNTAAGLYAVVPGGSQNTAGNQYSTVGGGVGNNASGDRAVVPGGDTNLAGGLGSFAAGSYARAGAAGAFTWADSQGVAVENSVADRTVFKNRGGFLVTGSTNSAMSGAANRGVLFTGDGLVGISTGTPYAALDVVSTGTTSANYAQIWRDSSGVVKASMSATGVMTASKFVGDGAGITGASGTDDTKVLKAGDTMAGQLTLAGSTLTVTGGAFSVGGSTLVVKEGNVGIGTTGPLSLLHINSGATGGTVLQIQNTSAGGTTAAINSTGSGSASGAGDISIEAPVGITRMLIQSADGNVGIGTTGPGAKLHVSGGDVNTASFKVEGSSYVILNAGNVGIGTTGPGAKLDVAGSLRSTGWSSPATGTGVEIGYVSGTGRILAYNRDTNAYSSAELGTPGQLFLKSDGNVGIGTTGTTLFDQIGAGRPLVVAAADSGTTIGGSSATLVISNNNTTTNNTSGLAFAAITGANTTHFADAEIVAIHGARVNGQYNPGQLAFLTSGPGQNVAPLERMRIDSAGNVGIGTTGPGQKLEVSSGNIKVTGLSAAQASVYINKPAASDAQALTFQTAGVDKWNMGVRGNNSYLELWDSPAGTNMLTIAPSGNVGIGTTSPQAKLAVELLHDGFNGYDPIMKLSAWQDGSNNSGNGGAIDFYVNNQTSSFPSSRIIHTMSSGTGGELSLATSSNYTTTMPDRKVVIKDNGNVGIGTVSPGYKLDVAGTVNAQEMRVNGVVLNPGTGSNWTVSGANVYRNGGNVGIGTTNPVNALDIRGTIYALANLAGYNPIDAENTNIGGFGPYFAGGGGDSAKYILAVADYTGSQKFKVDGLGNVGIGTASPAVKLHVETGAAGSPSAIFRQTHAGDSPGIQIYQRYGGAGDDLNYGIQLISGGVARFWVRGDGTTYNQGNVGIGTTSPTHNLHVAGNAIVVSSLSVSGSGLSGVASVFRVAGDSMTVLANGNIGIGAAPAAYTKLLVRAQTGYNFWVRNDGGTKLQLEAANDAGTLDVPLAIESSALYLNSNSGGNVGIGTTDLGSNKLSVAGNIALQGGSFVLTGASASPRPMFGSDATAHGQTIIRSVDSDAGDGIQFQNYAGSALAEILNSGNVGIGTTAPGYKLEVNGDINLAAGGVYRIGGVAQSGSSKWTQGTGDNIYRTLGNVGIGTGDPSLGVPLEVARTSGLYGPIIGLSGPAGAGGKTFYMLSSASGNSAGAGKFVLYESGHTGDLVVDNYNVGIGTTSPESRLHIRPGTDQNIKFSPFVNGGNGTALTASNDIAANKNNFEIIASNILLTPTNNVGIGTTNPQSSLHVFKSEGGVGTKDATITLGGYSTQGATLASYRPEGDSNSRGLMFSTRKTGVGMIDAMTLDQSGNVGIGTTGPGAKLHTVETSGSNLYIFVASTATDSGSYKMVVSTQGNVGIGTADPGNSKLRVKSGSVSNSLYNRSLSVEGDNNTFISMGVDNSLGANGRAWITAARQGVAMLDILLAPEGGNVGIGTTTPRGKLDVDNIYLGRTAATHGIINSNDGIYLNSDAENNGGPDSIVFGTDRTGDSGGTTWMTLTGGNVGIGTASPGYKLDVESGDLRVRLGTIRSHMLAVTTPQTHLEFQNANGVIGSITSNASATAYNTSSDRRLKENISTTTAGLAALAQIPVVDFNFISDPARRVQGFIAQDLYKYYPEAVNVGGDDPKKTPWSVDYGRLTPLLVKSVQELDQRTKGFAEYADNAAATAAGLPVGTFYRTGDLLKVVH